MTATEDPKHRPFLFRHNLEQDGFAVRAGSSSTPDPFALVRRHKMDSAGGNNAGQPYKILRVPCPRAEQHDIDKDFGLFHLRADEAVVYLGPTPPRCDYFSFTPYVWVRHADSLAPKGDWVFAATGDPLNVSRIGTEKTEENDGPFAANTLVIFAADEEVAKSVAKAALDANYPEEMINFVGIPSALVRMADATPGEIGDSLAILVRTANFAESDDREENIKDRAVKHHYLRSDDYAHVWRVTPSTPPTQSTLFEPQPPRQRRDQPEESRVPGLTAGLERLQQAILDAIPHTDYRVYGSIRWFLDSREVLSETNRASPSFHKFVAGEGSDTPYLRTALEGAPANFTLAEDEIAVVFGVNHAATGLATYSNFGVYGDWILGREPECAPFLFGDGTNPVWNGVAGANSHSFTGTATRYLGENDPMAPYLYAVKALRDAPTDQPEGSFVTVPSTSRDLPEELADQITGTSIRYIPLDQPLMIGYRAYLNPRTKAGPAYEDLIPDRVLWLKLPPA